MGNKLTTETAHFIAAHLNYAEASLLAGWFDGYCNLGRERQLAATRLLVDLGLWEACTHFAHLRVSAHQETRLGREVRTILRQEHASR